LISSPSVVRNADKLEGVYTHFFPLLLEGMSRRAHPRNLCIFYLSLNSFNMNTKCSNRNPSPFCTYHHHHRMFPPLCRNSATFANVRC
jgi:hypothetical protein